MHQGVATVLALVAVRSASDPDCHGYHEEYTQCDLPSCDSGCVPENCEFDSWGPWQQAGKCSGIEFASRVVRRQNNECGKPCDGPTTKSQRTVRDAECENTPMPCVWLDWSSWDDSSCKDNPYGQMTRARGISEQAQNSGPPCNGTMEETMTCRDSISKIDCAYSDWQEWTACSASCGPGRRTRMRSIHNDAEFGGAPCRGTLEEAGSCTVQPCDGVDCKFSDWSAWQACQVGQVQTYRTRKLLTPASGGGAACNSSLRETSACALPPDTFRLALWTDWSDCDKECNGQTFRSRQIKARGNGSESSLRETKACDRVPAECATSVDCHWDDWAAWSTCSSDCGKGTKIRERTYTPATGSGKPCLGAVKEAVVCEGESASCQKKDCLWAEWSEWSACTVSCGGGNKRRHRVIQVSPRHGGALCEPEEKSEVAPCNTGSCEPDCVDGVWGSWEEWSKCSATCGSAYKSRRRDVSVHPNSCGKPAVGHQEEYATCEVLKPCTPQKDCELSDWGDWSACSSSCFGITERNRAISTFAAGGGKPCVNTSLKEIIPCNPKGGEALPAGCGRSPPTDCELGDWSEWSVCTASCGGGQQTRQRSVKTPGTNGGAPCDHDLIVTEPCGTQACASNPCKDCQWGEWSDWSGCSKCGGQKWRHRSITQLPNECGKRCTEGAAKEVAECENHCDDEVFCAWSEWSKGVGCGPGVCGAASEMRSRQLRISKVMPAEGAFFKSSDVTRCAGNQEDMELCKDTPSCSPPCEPVDCDFDDWSEWQAPTCLGLCERHRRMKVMNNECGTPCSGPLIENKVCNHTECNKKVDCQFGDWEEWTVCDPTNTKDQRYRSRSVLKAPENGGQPCVGSLKETDDCELERPACADCELGDWNPWTPCDVTCGGGSQTRYREIETQATCGKPCSGALKELQVCGEAKCPVKPKVDCSLTDWSDWGGCEAGTNQKYRTRLIDTPAANGGVACEGDIKEVLTCGWEPIDCVATEWTPWSDCDRQCGSGQQRRQRQIHTYSKNGGRECPTELMQTAGCNTQPCSKSDCKVSEWSSWSTCSATCGPGSQKRSRVVTDLRSASGAGCEEALGEVQECLLQNCSRVDCAWGDWAQWSACSTTCGGGERRRNRHIAKHPKGGGAACSAEVMQEVGPCNTLSCNEAGCEDGKWQDWSAWAACSATCGGGQTFRTRRIEKPANACGSPPTGPERETVMCNEEISCVKSVDCEFSIWGDWTSCTQMCNGVKSHSRRVQQYGEGHGLYCMGALKEVDACNVNATACGLGVPVDCELGDWQDWSPCSVSCGAGQKTRSRRIAREPKATGAGCTGSLSELAQCDAGVCDDKLPVDCKIGEWEDWGACTKCGGQMTRHRSIEQLPANGGRPCPDYDTEETTNCPRECHDKQYCTWGDWGDWTECPVTCGQGSKSRRRSLMLSSTPAEAPMAISRAELVSLSHPVDEDHSSLQELIGAFSSGCGTVAVVLLGVRAWQSSRRSLYSPLRDAEALAGAQASGVLEETELPMVLGDSERRTYSTRSLLPEGRHTPRAGLD